MITTGRCTALLALTAGVGVNGCCHSADPEPTQSIRFQVAADTPGLTIGALTIRSLRLVVGPATLGSGDQLGCADCQSTGVESAPPSQLVSVPLDGTPVEVGIEQANAGHYTGAELELLAPDSAVLGATPDWAAGTTLVMDGVFNGSAFDLALAIEGTFRETLSTPLDLPTDAAGQVIAISITLPVTSWFSSGGSTLNPGDPAQMAQIERNIRSAFQPPESGGTQADAP